MPGHRKQEAAIDKTSPPNKRELKTQLEEKKRVAMARFNNRYMEATR